MVIRHQVGCQGDKRRGMTTLRPSLGLYENDNHTSSLIILSSCLNTKGARYDSLTPRSFLT